MSEKGKIQNLNFITKFLYEKCGITTEEGMVDGIINKNFASISKLLVSLAHEFKCPYQFPSNLEVIIVHREKLASGGVSSKTSRHMITGDESNFGVAADPTGTYIGNYAGTKELAPQERDAFDELFEPGAEAKLETVKKLLLTFVNKHLEKIGVQISNIGNQFHDGVYLIMLIGSLGNFFVPLYNYHIAPTTTEMKVHNVTFAFKLMDTLEIPRKNWNPADVVKQEMKTILRTLYTLFTTFKNTPA